MPIGNANIHIQLMYQCSLINLFHFCSLNLIVYRTEKKAKVLFLNVHSSNSQIEIQVSFSRSTNVNVNMSFPNSNFEGNISTYVFGKSFWHYRDLKSECWTSRHILCKKILNFSYVWRLEYLCKKVKYVWSSHFPDAIKKNMQIGNDSFLFKYPVRCKQ